MARNETGVMVRVRPETLKRLDAIRRRLTLAAANGLCEPWWADDEPTNNEILAKLITDYERKRERGRQARKAARRKREAEALEDMYGPCLPWWAPGTLYASLPSGDQAERKEVGRG